MRILRERETWTRTRPKRRRCTSSLTPDEQESVRRVLRLLTTRYRSLAELARALGLSETTLNHVLGRRRVTADVAVRTARLAGLSLDVVVTWKAPAVCPLCGRTA